MIANEKLRRKSTIGILLCKQSDEALVDLTLPENANIYAKEYKLYLPDKKLLTEKIKRMVRMKNKIDSEGESAIYGIGFLPYFYKL